jgi:Flp pilus assembly protein TadD
VSLIAIAIPMLSADAVRSSEGKLQAGDTSGALDDARFAADVEPWAASPKLQEAVVLEARGDVANAVVAARDATEAESTNWRTWLVLSRLEAQTGNFDGSVAAYREARSLNPRSPLFQ